MLARTFLTAKQLHCSQIERRAAIEVLGMLERGEVKYTPITLKPYWAKGDWGAVSESIPADAFNIAYWAHCMGGWMERAKGRGLSMQCQERWSDLFEPAWFDSRPEYYTPERCARALNAKLTTGKAVWN